MNVDLSDITAKRLYELRTKNGYTMEKLAEMVGVSKGTISKWEKGQIRNMRRDKVLILAKIFNVLPTYILGYEEPAPSIVVELDDVEERRKRLSERMNTFIDLYSQLNQSNQELVDNMIEALSKKQ